MTGRLRRSNVGQTRPALPATEEIGGLMVGDRAWTPAAYAARRRIIERLRPLEASESRARKVGMTPAVARRLRVLLADPFRHCSAPLTPAQERLARQMGLGVAL